MVTKNLTFIFKNFYFFKFSVNSNQEFESLLKEDKKGKAKEENKKERAESKKNKDSEKREKEENWKKFFEACCDIPTETRKKYASTFVKQRIQPHLLRDLGYFVFNF